MAKNAIKNYFRTSKMAAGGHLVKRFEKKKRIEMTRKEIKISKKLKVAY